MSKLQLKALRFSLAMLALMLAACALFFAFGVYRPLRENSIHVSEDALDSAAMQAYEVCRSIKEYASFVAYGDAMNDLVRSYAEDPSAQNRYAISDCLNQMRNVRTGVHALVLEVRGERIAGLTGINDAERAYLDSEAYRALRGRDRASKFSPGFFSPSPSGEPMIAFSQKYVMRNQPLVLTVFLDFSEWFGGVERTLANYFDRFAWMYDSGASLFARGEEADWLQLEADGGVRFGTSEAGDGGVQFVALVMDSDYLVAARLDRQTLTGMFSRYLALIVLFFAALVACMFAGMFYVTGKLSRPVAELSKAMEDNIANNFDMHLQVTSDDEIGRMQAAFNMMNRALSSYLEERTQKAVEAQRMHFGLLISQVDPHFICNTLRTINYLARTGRSEDVVVVSDALSNILRDRLRLKNFKVFDSVAQELETVNQYMKIQSYRYGKNIRLEIECPPELLECSIPKNLIQPLVENSIFHGLANEDAGTIEGTISIRVFRSGNALALSVVDDGIGISEEMLEAVRKRSEGFVQSGEKGHGIGLHGVLKRLDILYGEHYRCEVERLAPHGTRVCILLDGDHAAAEELQINLNGSEHFENYADHD